MKNTKELDCSNDTDYILITVLMIGKDERNNYIVYQCIKCELHISTNGVKNNINVKAYDRQVVLTTDGNRLGPWIEDSLWRKIIPPGKKFKNILGDVKREGGQDKTYFLKFRARCRGCGHVRFR